MIKPVVLLKNEGRGVGGGPEGGDCGQRWCGQVQHDTEILQRYLHERLQEDYRRGLSRKTDRVSTVLPLKLNFNLQQQMFECLSIYRYCSHFPTPTLSFLSSVTNDDLPFYYCSIIKDTHTYNEGAVSSLHFILLRGNTIGKK